MILRLAGSTSISEQRINAGAQNYAMAAERLAAGKGANAVSSATMPPGQFGHVEVKGRGPVPMILFADIRADWTLYQSFMERNADRYTMYAVTQPGFGGSPPPPRPGTFDATPTQWWSGLEQAAVTLIEKQKLNKPVLVGINASVYLVTRLAADHPEKCRAAVILNGLVFMIMTSPTNPTKPITFDERQNAGKQPVSTGLLQELLPLSRPTREYLDEQLKTLPAARNPLAINTRNEALMKSYFVSFGSGTDLRSYRYVSELSTTDLTADLKKFLSRSRRRSKQTRTDRFS